ncbi:MAG TPA: hypothetical protein VIO64_09170 [Pseudobacteroides sp.]|uniref:hypothetical protein n=1 Tax=Pseudobacteroides sp. TaxID=1968840 RepID=UPI002F9209B2
MARISKIRFINFTYNDNRHIYDQTFDFFKGEDTLLNLQNGGGKTVLVQMMMQPIIPKQRLKDRLFKSYFSNSKAPVYIMIEWIIDDSPKKVLTGIGIKRILGRGTDEDEGENIKVVTFISEYESHSSFDIKNIELLEENRGFVKLLEFDKVIKNLSNAEKEGNDVWLFRWDLPDDKKEYARRLLNYKINQLEWKNLMVKINESEAGLNSFFNDCKTNGLLIKKWFIPTIEEQLNKNSNSIENIKELIKNHAEQLVKNEDMIREKEVFEDFKVKARRLIESLDNLRQLTQKSENVNHDLGNAYLFTERETKVLEQKRNEISEAVKNTDGKIIELEYEKLSSEYHETTDLLDKQKERTEELEKGISVLGDEKSRLEKSKNTLDCIKLSDEIKNLNTKISKFQTELEKESLKQEDVKSMLCDIEYSLKEKYKEKVSYLEKTLEAQKFSIANEKSKMSETNEEIVRIKREISSIDDALISIRGRIAVVEEAEAVIKSSYPDFNPVKNTINGGYDKESLSELLERLSVEENNIADYLSKLREKSHSDIEKLDELDNRSKDLRDKNTLLAVEKSKKQGEIDAFESEKSKLLQVLRAYELGEESIFDKERILSVLGSDLEKYHKIINDINLENSILKKQLSMYETGKVFDLADEIKKIFDESNIFVEFGFEWLKGLTENKNAKIKLVKNNPFLPYSLIVSKKDLERIQELEVKAMLTSVVPILVREKLENVLDIKSGNNIHCLCDLNFLIAFDDRILNKNYLKEAIDEINIKINKNNEILMNVRSAVKNTEIAILNVEGFSYTRDGTDKFLKDMKNINEAMVRNLVEITDAEKEITYLKEEGRLNGEKLGELEKEKADIIKKRQDIEGFLRRLEGYYHDLENKGQKEKDRKNLLANHDALENQVFKIRESINAGSLKVSNLGLMLEKEKSNLSKYTEAKAGKMLDEAIENLEAKRAALSSQMGGKIHNLMDIIEDYREQKKDKLHKIKEYGIAEESYMGMEFSRDEYSRIQEEIASVLSKIEELSLEKNQLQFKIAELNSDLKYMMKNIHQRCGYDKPKNPDEIRKLDYDGEKKALRENIKIMEKELALIKASLGSVERLRYSLEEYAGFASKVTDIIPIEGKLEENVKGLVKEFKDIEAAIYDHKNMLVGLYNDIELEFSGKADVFKNLFGSILDGNKRYQPQLALNAFNRVYMQIDRKLMQHSIDLKKIDSMENCIIDNTLSYLLNVYDEMNSIDRNSTIELDGKRVKMLIINLPEKDTLETISLKEYIKNTIRNCVSLYKQGKPMDGLLTNEIATYDLFDRLVGIKKIEIILMKIEPNKLKKKTWKQVIEENSGGEKFVSAFVVFISLLTYMRGNNIMGASTDSKVLIMDNPFGPITSEHLLKPLFEISRKYNTQLICLTDLKEHSIFDRFNLIYSLNIEREVGKEDEYVEIKTIKKDVVEEEDEVLIASMFRIEDKSRFELAN